MSPVRTRRRNNQDFNASDRPWTAYGAPRRAAPRACARWSDLSLQYLLQEVPVAVHLIFRAVTKESHRALLRQMLE